VTLEMLVETPPLHSGRLVLADLVEGSLVWLHRELGPVAYDSLALVELVQASSVQMRVRMADGSHWIRGRFTADGLGLAPYPSGHWNRTNWVRRAEPWEHAPGDPVGIVVED
jgi:hypothetical protein